MVPDADKLISLSEVLETPVAILLGETVANAPLDDIGVLSGKLEVINLQLVRAKESKRRTLHWLFVILGAIAVIAFVELCSWGSPYLGWDFSDPETAVAGTFLHGFEFAFVRIAPFVLVGSIIGGFLTRKKQ